MHKPAARPRRTRSRQSSSHIPVRTSSREQSHKTKYSVHADGSGGEISDNQETERTLFSSRSSSNEDSSKQIESNERVFIEGSVDGKEAEKTLATSRRVTGNGEYQKTVYHLRAEGDGEGLYKEGSTNNEESVVYTSRSDDGEITTVRQTFKIVGTLDKDNRSSKESLNSNVDSAFHGSLDFLDNRQDNDTSYSEEKMIKAVSFEEVGSGHDYDGKLWIKPTDNIKQELEEEVGEDEEILREELLRIFDRERFTLGSFFKNKMDDLARDYRQRELDIEDQSRTEMAELENEMAREKAEMQKVFAEEIASLTRTFNEDRSNIESYHKEQIKQLREQQAEDHKDMDQKLAREKAELKEKMESEFQAVLKAELSDTQQSSSREIANKEEKFSREKLEMERRHSVELHEAEMNTKKVKDELEMMFSQEKARLEERIRDLENHLRQEQEIR